MRSHLPEFSDRSANLENVRNTNFGVSFVIFTLPPPSGYEREVIEVIASYDCLAKQIHLPMQSGDEKVLIKMNRRHSMDKYRRIVADIRELIPQATLFTDIIVGFTGEGEPEFGIRSLHLRNSGSIWPILPCIPQDRELPASVGKMKFQPKLKKRAVTSSF